MRQEGGIGSGFIKREKIHTIIIQYVDERRSKTKDEKKNIYKLFLDTLSYD